MFDEFLNLRPMFQYCSISFVSRLKNLRADCLAKGARSRGFVFPMYFLRSQLGWCSTPLGWNHRNKKIWSFRCQKKILKFNNNIII